MTGFPIMTLGLTSILDMAAIGWFLSSAVYYQIAEKMWTELLLDFEE